MNTPGPTPMKPVSLDTERIHIITSAVRPQVRKQLPRLLALCADKKNYGKALVIRSLKNNTRRKEINPLGALSRKDRYQAQRILETAAA